MEGIVSHLKSPALVAACATVVSTLFESLASLSLEATLHAKKNDIFKSKDTSSRVCCG